MNTESSRERASVELLAPAGDWTCAQAAIENGADAIYFGLDCGFNARYRAQNFGIPDLPELAAMLRRRGVRGYATLNTLVFPSEMSALVDVVEQIARSGIDAVLVQDFGVARLVREICPELEVHASTQMSLTSAETIELAAELGLARVVLARELSIDEIRKITGATEMPIEIFIHGALCVAYSGQCLTSESLGGRSANRGQCAQACRLPYELIVDGQDVDLGDVKYLLSPQDLAAYAAIPDVVDAGVASIKIEGRLKTPEYVANITRHYRDAIDQAVATGTVQIDDDAKREMELSFSRGFSPGWIQGNDHKRLVPGRHSAKRGILLGSVLEVGSRGLLVELAAPVSLGDGLAILGAEGAPQQGGRIYDLWDQRDEPRKSMAAGQTAWIGFGRDEIDWSCVHPEAEVFKNDDPQLNRRLRQTFAGEDPRRRRPIDMTVTAKSGEPIRVSASIGSDLLGCNELNAAADVELCTADYVGEMPLATARNRPADEATLREKLGRLGGTPLELGRFEANIVDSPMVPLGLLNQIRRQLVDDLLGQLTRPPARTIDVSAGRRLLEPITPDPNPAGRAEPKLGVLCRTLEQLDAACRCGIDIAYADFHDVRQYRLAVPMAKGHGTPIAIGTVRMQKPGEMGLLRVLARHQPDAILARNLAAMNFAREKSIPMIADFSLNVANHRSAQWLCDVGAQRVTASYDLNRDQLFDLVDSMPPAWLEVVMHQHMPMFHMEHCVFCAVMSPGTNKTNCGRPCDRHVVALRDRVGAEHPLQADVACRNTLYNATPQSGSEVVGDLVGRGVGWFRIELLEEDSQATKRTIELYQKLLAGRINGVEVWQQLNATNRLGVTRGTLEPKRNPLAII